MRLTRPLCVPLLALLLPIAACQTEETGNVAEDSFIDPGTADEPGTIDEPGAVDDPDTAYGTAESALAAPPTPSKPEKGECTITVRAVVNGDIGGNYTKIRCNGAKNVRLTVEVTTYGASNDTKRRTHKWSSLTGQREDQLPIALIATRKLEAESVVCYDTPGFRKCRSRISSVSNPG